MRYASQSNQPYGTLLCGFVTLSLKAVGFTMTTTYDAECDGCGQVLEIQLEGYIGNFEKVWCEDCGYDGENISNEPVEEIEEKPFYSLAQVKVIFANMPEDHELKTVLGLTLDFAEKYPYGLHTYLVAASQIIRHGGLGGEEE